MQQNLVLYLTSWSVKCSEHSVTNDTGLQYVMHFSHSFLSSIFLYTSHYKIGKKVRTKNRKMISCADLRLLYFPTVILFSESVSFLSLRYSATQLRLYKNHSSFTRWQKSVTKLSRFIWTWGGENEHLLLVVLLLKCLESGEETYSHTHLKWCLGWSVSTWKCKHVGVEGAGFTKTHYVPFFITWSNLYF